MDEVAWLIEFGGTHSTILYWTGEAIHHWSPEHEKACRFARKEDAERIARLVQSHDVMHMSHRVAEHAWMSSKP